jgi:hypothetical protein
MELSAIGAAKQRRPFQPFRLRLADGRDFLVSHCDFIALPEKGRSITVFDKHNNFEEVIDPLLIVSISFEIDSP